MNITLANIGKRFNTEWIFRNIDFEFSKGSRYAIVGPNGTGKSTLLQVIAGYVLPNEGDISWKNDQKTFTADKIYKEIALAAPYLELIEEMTLAEFLNFHREMKGLKEGISVPEIAAQVNLANAVHKQIRYYSSGMKQRVKLAQAFFCNASVLLLDEPLTNLDAEGVSSYYNLIDRFTQDRLIIVSSNDEKEYSFCDKKLDLLNFK
ncbi:MAG: ABC transporter ATP-binding protein [Chitinophagaceae bacterium]|nr:ABC transporter ATP-binding protein [Chitinophagaceae bacterium]